MNMFSKIFTTKIDNSTILNHSFDSKSRELYDNMKSVYTGYVEKMEDSEVGESFTRYNVELNLLKNMKIMAEKYHFEDEVSFISEKQQNAADKLEEMGFKINLDS